MTVAETPTGVHVWSTEEKRILVQAARSAPRRWLGDKWALEIHEDKVELFERLNEARWLRDHGGRARLIACGAVLVHLDVAMRMLGWLPSVDLTTAPSVPDRVATIKAVSRLRPDGEDFARYGAMSGRTSRPVPTSLDRWCQEIAKKRQTKGVRVAALSARRAGSLPSVGGQICRELAPVDGERPWAAFLVTTTMETRNLIVQAGSVAQGLWLATVEHGLLGKTVTAPFDDPVLRGSLYGVAGVPGTPQLVVIVNQRRNP